MTTLRKSTRIPLATIASITLHGLQTAVEAPVRDVSVGGIGMYVSGRYLQGELLVISVSFVTEEGETIKESMMGRVAWVKPLPPGNHSAIGIELPDMQREHPKLHAYIEHLEQAKVVPLHPRVAATIPPSARSIDPTHSIQTEPDPT